MYTKYYNPKYMHSNILFLFPFVGIPNGDVNVFYLQCQLGDLSD